MGQSQWSLMANSEGYPDVAGTLIKRGVTSGIARPTGNAGSSVFGFNSISDVQSAAAFSVDITDFNPVDPPASGGGGGGSMRACLQRGQGGGREGFSPFIFLGAASDDVNAEAYLLGLEDAESSRIVLAKGPIVNGIPAVADAEALGTTILRYSTETFDWGEWAHLRLDMIVNSLGDESDVILRAYRSDISATIPVESPTWTAVVFDDDYDFDTGAFVDDPLQINSGSAPFASGYMGFGFRADLISRRAFMDYIEAVRQNPTP